ncbi:MAG: PAS domain S-box protein, partial [Candidatus Paceibacterota bacterium]
SPQPMWVYDSDTLKFLDVNDSAIHHYGYTREEFLNLSIDQIRPPSEVETLKKVLGKSLNSEQRGYNGKFLHRKKSGKKIVVDIYSNYIRFGDKNARLVLANDITERENQLKSIQQQNKILREIAWTQSHTLRAPLARIMGLVEFIKLKGSEDKELEEIIQHINTSAHELDEIVQEIVNKSNSINT